MNKPVLFISHSTNHSDEKTRNVSIRDSLFRLLCEKWDVFLDRKRIDPGDKWRPKILHYLAQAQAGIILFNERATTKSEWVRAEALILCFRKSINPKLQIIPVLLDGKEIENTCFDQYEPFQLHEIQAISDVDYLIDNPPPDVFAEGIARLFDNYLIESPPVSRWIIDVKDILWYVNVDVLERAASELGIVIDSLDKDSSDKEEHKNRLSQSVAELMHHKPPLECILAFREMLIQLNEEKIEILKDHLCAKWVENEAVEILLCASRDPHKFSILTINTKEHDEIQAYLNRASIEIRKLARAFSVSGAAGEEDNVIISHIKEGIYTNLGIDPKDSTPIDKLIGNDIAICALPLEYAKERILKRLREDFPGIIFIVQVKEEALDHFKDIGGIPLCPLLDDDKYRELKELKRKLTWARKQKRLGE